MQDFETWRDLLSIIIGDPRQKQHLAEVMNINPITLDRWARGEGNPRDYNLKSLVTNLPQYREQLLDLIRKEKRLEEFLENVQEDISQDITSDFYRSVLKYRASTGDMQRFWTVGGFILQMALEQLDPERLGMAVILVRCMPPAEGDTKVRSLRESLGRGNPPWVADLEHHALFLGAESLAGHAVTLGRPRVVDDVKEDQYLIPVQVTEHEISAAAYPIMYTGRIAGCLLISSTQRKYFITETRLALIQKFADLMALAFESHQFYEPRDIELGMMPDHEVQRQQFANFRQRVNAAMIRGSKDKRTLNNVEAEEYVWRTLEQELLAVAAGHPIPSDALP